MTMTRIVGTSLGLLLVPLLSACAQESPTPAATAPLPVATASAAPETQPGMDPPTPGRTPDVIYVPTPDSVVKAMLELAEVGKDDVLFDLGSGDGRIPIAAAKTFGIRAVGIDIDPQRIREANENAQAAGVTELVTFREEDLFQSDIGDATVVTLYLLQSLNMKLRPKLLSELKPGTRIVSHSFDMGDEWEPEETRRIENRNIYLWTVPER
ncbi:MAG: class I SAM-dependent methyltransferase [Luteimonas sp.]|nr:class I SAM-dependent methyltransferase [Luteimonas sp.]